MNKKLALIALVIILFIAVVTIIFRTKVEAPAVDRDLIVDELTEQELSDLLGLEGSSTSTGKSPGVLFFQNKPKVYSED